MGHWQPVKNDQNPFVEHPYFTEQGYRLQANPPGISGCPRDVFYHRAKGPGTGYTSIGVRAYLPWRVGSVNLTFLGLHEVLEQVFLTHGKISIVPGADDELSQPQYNGCVAQCLEKRLGLVIPYISNLAEVPYGDDTLASEIDTLRAVTRHLGNINWLLSKPQYSEQRAAIFAWIE